MFSHNVSLSPILFERSGMVFFEPTEQYLSFYDIFLRNAFGNYRDILKEFSFTKIMAEWLSFNNNKSLQWNIENGEIQYPDENVRSYWLFDLLV